jgi:hypothetical protein
MAPKMRPIYWGAISFVIGLVGWQWSINLYGATVHSIPFGSAPHLSGSYWGYS